MAHLVSLSSCPACAGTVTQIGLGDELVLRSCSTCDLRWWHRGDRIAPRHEALALVAAGGSGRRQTA